MLLDFIGRDEDKQYFITNKINNPPSVVEGTEIFSNLYWGPFVCERASKRRGAPEAPISYSSPSSS